METRLTRVETFELVQVERASNPAPPTPLLKAPTKSYEVLLEKLEGKY